MRFHIRFYIEYGDHLENRKPMYIQTLQTSLIIYNNNNNLNNIPN